MSVLLEIEALEAGYGNSQVLFGIDLVLREREMLAMLGRNGMGKTTTVRSLFGLTSIRAGAIRWKGMDITRMPAREVAARGVALVPEGRQVFPNLTVRENLVAFARRHDGRDAWTLDKLLEFFPQLRERTAQMGSRLSGGEQQMLAIGRALMTNPQLLILDEVTEGLAPLVREEVWTCLASLRAAGQSLLVIDKHVERLVALADRHVILERGRVAWSGDSQQLGARRGLWEKYLGV